MTGFEMLLLSSVCLMFAIMFIYMTILLIKEIRNYKNGANNKGKLNTNNSDSLYNSDGNWVDGCDNRNNTHYKDGEIDIIFAVVVLKNMKKRIGDKLSPVEKESIDKGIKSLLSMERLNNFIKCKTLDK